jgi:hypothetical protein
MLGKNVARTRRNGHDAKQEGDVEGVGGEERLVSRGDHTRELEDRRAARAASAASGSCTQRATTQSRIVLGVSLVTPGQGSRVHGVAPRSPRRDRSRCRRSSWFGRTPRFGPMLPRPVPSRKNGINDVSRLSSTLRSPAPWVSLAPLQIGTAGRSCPPRRVANRTRRPHGACRGSGSSCEGMNRWVSTRGTDLNGSTREEGTAAW